MLKILTPHPITTQPLQEREIERIGSNKPIKVDIRVISATNINLEEAVFKEKFRQDLYFRLNVVPISIPPLRERKGDIPLLAEHFLNKFNTTFNKKIPGFSKKALDPLCRYHWPGNIRELENLIERIIVLSKGNDPIELKDIPFEILISSGQDIKDEAFPKTGLIKAREEFEKRLVLNALETTGWNQTEAAKILKISRNHFTQKTRQLGIRIKKVD